MGKSSNRVEPKGRVGRAAVKWFFAFLILTRLAHAQGTVSPGTVGQSTYYTGTTTVSGGSPVNAALEPGSDIVAQINNALTVSNDVFIPAGTYSTACTSSWTSDLQSGDPMPSPYYVGVKLPTGAHIHGAGKGLTVINVTRASGLTAPACSLFANATRSGYGNNADITLDSMTINWTETGCTTGTGCNYSTAAIEIVGADRFTMHDVELQGQPNRLLALIDVTLVSIHDNSFLVSTPNTNNPGTAFGNSAIANARFQSGTPYTLNAGVIFNNQVVDTGYPTNVSLVVLTQSNMTFGPDNSVDMLNYIATGDPTGYEGQTIETGDDNDGNIETGLLIHGNHFYGGVVRLPVVGTEFSGNLQWQGAGVLAEYAATPDNTATASRLKIQNNTLQCPGTGVNCGIFVGGNSTQGIQFVTVSDNTIEDRALSVFASGSGQNGAPNCVIENNRLYNSPDAAGAGNGALLAYGCAVVHGNLVKNPDADVAGGNAGYYAINASNSSAAVPTLIDDLSGNRIIDDQVNYSTGTVCSVANSTSSTCLTSGTSRWLYSSGASWSQAWPNRYIFISSTPYMIRAFFDGQHLELENPVAVFSSSGVAYSLTWTLDNGFYLGTNIVDFANNYGFVLGPGPNQGYMKGYPGGGWITDVSGNTIQNLANNTFISPRQAVGGTNYNYYNQSPSPVGGVSCNQSTCSTGTPVALYTMPNVGTGSGGVPGILFHADVSLACTSATSSATVSLTLTYTDVSGTTQTVTTGPATCTTLGATSVKDMGAGFMMYGNSAVSYSVTTANSPSYQARVIVFQESTN